MIQIPPASAFAGALASGAEADPIEGAAQADAGAEAGGLAAGAAAAGPAAGVAEAGASAGAAAAQRAPGGYALAAFGVLPGVHADVRALASPAIGGAGAVSTAYAQFTAGVVLAGAPLAAKVAGNTPPLAIGGPNPPPLEAGRSAGPVVEDLKRHLNVARENLWRAAGYPGWPTDYLKLDGKFDAATRDALKSFQRSVGLPATGIADAATQHLLKLESDNGYHVHVSEVTKVRVRELLATPGLDDARIEGAVKLLTETRMSTRLDDHAHALVVQALGNAKLDPAFVGGLARLLTDEKFVDLATEDKTAIVAYVKNHADARMVGNVLRMLQGEPDAGTMVGLASKELKREQAAAGTGAAHGRNATQDHLMAATGRIPDAAWKDTTLLVGRLTQNATGSDGVDSTNRCGPANLLAGALLQGPDAAASLLEKASATAGNFLTREERRELKALAGQIRDRSASFEDMSLAQDLLYRASNRRMTLQQWVGENPNPANLNSAQKTELAALLSQTTAYTPKDLGRLSALISKSLGREVTARFVDEPLLGTKAVMLDYQASPAANRDGSIGGGLDIGELAKAADAGGLKSSRIGFSPKGADAAADVLKHLKPGESAVLLLAGGAGGTAADHFVSVGVLKDGRPYIYNPDPLPGDATLTVGTAIDPQPKVFTDELAKYSARATSAAHAGAAAVRITN